MILAIHFDSLIGSEEPIHESPTMTGKRLFGLICPTVFQGPTMCVGDIYLTKEDATEEYKALQRMRAESDAGDDDTGYEVLEIYVQKDGSIVDPFEASITITDGDKNAVLAAVAELELSRPLNDLQQFVLKEYAEGDFSNLETIGQTRGTECGDTLVQFLMAEASDADGDPAQLAHQLNSAINQLRDLQQALEQHAETQRPKG